MCVCELRFSSWILYSIRISLIKITVAQITAGSCCYFHLISLHLHSVVKAFVFSTIEHFLLLVETPAFLWIIALLLQVTWWIIHWVFWNWDLPKLADGALVLSPLQAGATYGKLIPRSLLAICSFWADKSPCFVKLKGQTIRYYRCMLDFAERPACLGTCVTNLQLN